MKKLLILLHISIIKIQYFYGLTAGSIICKFEWKPLIDG